MDGQRVTESVSLSPFDYKRNCLLYLPQLPPSQSSEAYYDELTDEIAELIRAAWGHALVLFTSYAAMSAVKDRLRSGNSASVIYLGQKRPAHDGAISANTGGCAVGYRRGLGRL